MSGSQKIKHLKNLMLIHIIGCLSLVIMVCVVIGALIYDRHLTRMDQKREALHVASALKQQMVTSISNGITSLNEIKEVSKLYCAGPYEEQRFINQNERIKRRFELIRAADHARLFFTEKFRLLLEDFLAWEQAIPDYCNKNIPSKMVWNDLPPKNRSELI